MQNTNKALLVAAITAAIGVTTAEASHFRGGAMVPQVSATGLLTVNTTTFWRPTGLDDVNFISGASLAETSKSTDTTDSRYTRVTQTFAGQLSGAQTVDLSWGSCCRVGGIINSGDGSSSDSWQLDSSIVWDGSTANAPILFDFAAIQSEVVRGDAYADNLGALSGSGLTLTYDQVLNNNGSSSSNFVVAPGFTIDPVTGALNISAADTATYGDNPTTNIGADYFFSGNIHASDGSSVEFDWLFDSVGVASNKAPIVDDIVINALVGDNISQIVAGTDPEGEALTWDFLSFVGAGGNGNQTFDPLTQTFAWDTTGSAIGTYFANVRAADPQGLTDTGTVTINLTKGVTPPTQVPEPASALLAGLGLVALGWTRRRRNNID